jgi:hypothetical protein
MFVNTYNLTKFPGLLETVYVGDTQIINITLKNLMILKLFTV